ncbi:MAG: ribonuclease HI family protein [Planctomycetota bacterium]
MDRLKLLKAAYEAIQWDQLYELAPEATRQEVDELFQDLRRLLGPRPQEDLAEEVVGGTAVLRCDGASKGNPGPAGIGCVIETAEGREVAAWGRPIGRATNNVAEYRAAVAALRKALQLGVRKVRLRADSQLMVRQINGRYRVKSAGLKPLHAEVMELLGRFEDYDVAHVSRDENARADELADRAARRAAKEG